MTNGETIIMALIARAYFMVRPDRLIRWRRAMVQAIREGRDTLKGSGAWATHQCIGLDEVAICGAPVAEWSGPGSEATCRKCRRLVQKARKPCGEVHE